MRLTESLADELWAERIRARQRRAADHHRHAADREAMPGADMSKWVKPSEVAEAMAFLISDAASAVSGQLLQVGR